MEDYGAIDTAAPQTSGPKLGKQLRRIISAVAAVALVVGASAALSVNRLPGANLITTLSPDADAVDFVVCTMQWDPVCADGNTPRRASLRFPCPRLAARNRSTASRTARTCAGSSPTRAIRRRAASAIRRARPAAPQ